jgi:hypothetical protein
MSWAIATMMRILVSNSGWTVDTRIGVNAMGPHEKEEEHTKEEDIGDQA